MVVVQVGDPDALDFFDQAIPERLTQHLMWTVSAHIEDKAMTIPGYEELGRAHVPAPRGELDMFRKWH